MLLLLLLLLLLVLLPGSGVGFCFPVDTYTMLQH
jgi:hypothetical protein